MLDSLINSTLNALSLELPHVLTVPIVVVLAMLLGSFCNMLIYRLPLIILGRQIDTEFTPKNSLLSGKATSLTLWQPGSHCPSCGKGLGLRDLLPILSYLWTLGKCRHCEASIGRRYLFIELFSVFHALTLLFSFGPTLYSLCIYGFILILLAMTIIDFEHQLLPDELTLPLLWLGLLVNSYDIFTSLYAAVWGAAIGYCGFWLINAFFKLIRGLDGMGAGDFKLLAALGAWLGIDSLPLIVLYASVIGIAMGLILILTRGHNQHTPIPFGPALALAGAVLIFWQSVIEWFP